MNLAAVVVTIYGAFTLIGGIIGYLKAKSTASIVAGSFSGAILFICAYAIQRGSVLAQGLSLIVALLLGGRFFGTWRKNRRVMPDLLMVLLSGFTVAVIGAGLIR